MKSGSGGGDVDHPRGVAEAVRQTCVWLQDSELSDFGQVTLNLSFLSCQKREREWYLLH